MLRQLRDLHLRPRNCRSREGLVRQDRQPPCSPPARALAVTLPHDSAPRLKARLVLPASLDAPVASGQIVGEVVYTVGDTVVKRVDPPRGPGTSPAANIFIVIRDAFAKLFNAIFG